VGGGLVGNLSEDRLPEERIAMPKNSGAKCLDPVRVDADRRSGLLHTRLGQMLWSYGSAGAILGSW